MSALPELQRTYAPEPRTRIYRDFWFLALVICGIGSALAKFLGLSLIPSFLALFLLTLCVYPCVRYFRERDSTVPAVAILTGAYAIQFAVPVFLGEREIWLVGGYEAIDDASLNAALAIAILSLAAFLIISYSRLVARVVSNLPAFHLHLNRTRALIFCLFFGTLTPILSQQFPQLPYESQVQFAALFRVLQCQMLIAIGVLAWLKHTSQSPWLRIGYYSLIAVAVLIGLSTGFLEATLVPIGLMFACQWIYERRISKAIASVLIGAMLLLNPVKAEFRQATWNSSVATDSVLERARLWVETGVTYWSDLLQGRIQGDDPTLQLLRRTSMIDALAHVYAMTPNTVPFLNGETYYYFAYSLIPRFLWPEKPVTSANRTLAIEYDLTTPEGAENSTFGISLLGEGYANFGWGGSILIMSLLALVLVVLQRLFTTSSSGPGGYALFLAFFVFFLNGLGSSAEILFGNLLQSMVTSYTLMYWVSERQHHSRSMHV